MSTTIREPGDFRRYHCGAEGCTTHVDVPFPELEPAQMPMYRSQPALPSTWGSCYFPGKVTEDGESSKHETLHAYLCPYHVDAMIRVLYPSMRAAIAPPYPSPPSQGPYR